LVTVVPFLVVSWRMPNTYPTGGVRRGTATQVPRDPGQPRSGGPDPFGSPHALDPGGFPGVVSFGMSSARSGYRKASPSDWWDAAELAARTLWGGLPSAPVTTRR